MFWNKRDEKLRISEVKQMLKIKNHLFRGL